MSYRLKSYGLAAVLAVLGLAFIGSTATTARAAGPWPPVNSCIRQVSFAGWVSVICTLTGPSLEITGNATVSGYRVQWGIATPSGIYRPPAKTVDMGFWLPAVNARRLPALAPVLAQPSWQVAIVAVPPAGVDGVAVNLAIWISGSNGKMRIRIPYIAGQSPQDPHPLTPVVI